MFAPNIATKIKKIGKWVIIALLAIALLHSCYQNYSMRKEYEKSSTTKEFEKQELANTVQYYKDENGKLHATIKTTEVFNQWKTGFIDSLAKELDIKNKQIKSVTQVVTNTSGGGTLIVDTSWVDVDEPIERPNDDDVKPIYHFRYRDSWTSIWGAVDSDTSGVISYSTVDTIQMVDYWKRKKFLGMRIGRPEGYVAFTNANPNTKVTGAKKLDLKPPKQNWTLGVGVGIGYPVNQFKLNEPVITVGLSFHRNLLRF